MRLIKVYGPPGCGKTTELLGLITDLLNKPVEPDTICFISFSKAAIRVARDRIRTDALIEKEQLTHWRTLHSTAFKYLGWTPKQVMQHRHWFEFGQEHGFTFSVYTARARMPIEATNHADQLMLAYHNAKNTMTTDYPEVVDRLGFRDLDPAAVQDFADALARYKEEKKVQDFDDMLEAAIRERAVPTGLEFIIVDEAQDLTPLQKTYLDVIIEENQPNSVVLAFDPAQAIYTYAGASPELLKTVESTGDKFLRESHRLPEQIALYSRRLSEESIEYHGRLTGEQHIRTALWNDIVQDLENRGDDGPKTFILARSNYIVSQACRYLDASGIDYHTRDEDDEMNLFRETLMWLLEAKERDHYGVTKTQLLQIARCMKVESKAKPGGILPYGYKATLEREAPMDADAVVDLRKEAWYGKWLTALERDQVRGVFMPEFRRHVPRLTRLANLRGAKILGQTARVIVMTIHQSKGKECDQTILIPSLPKRVLEGLRSLEPGKAEIAMAGEKRLWYVAVTRCRNELVLIHPYDPTWAHYEAFDLPEPPETDDREVLI